MMSEIRENTVQKTLCMPLWGRLLAAKRCPDLFSDRDAERIIRELGIDWSDIPLTGSNICGSTA